MDEPLKLPRQYPSSTHEVVVVLEDVHLSIDGDIDTGSRSYELISYHCISKPDEICDRIQCASIVIATQSFITSDSLGEAPYLKCIITPTAGINHIDVEECRRRGIKVAKCNGSTSLAVPDHALSLYFAARRKTVLLHNDIRTLDEEGRNSWKRQRSIATKLQTANGHPPCSIDEEVVGIIGYGCIGKRISVLCQGLGMQVLVAERKNGTSIERTSEESAIRHPFKDVIARATVLFICCTASADTRFMIDAAELSTMRPEMVMINVSRGNILNTDAVVTALRKCLISGVAVDVFDHEPASTPKDSAFLAEDTKDLNLTFSPHVGYFSTKTVVTMKMMVKNHIKSFVEGNFDRFVV
ncbi:D-isomer specific 2-hydroxyacid dehydrogenase [Xylaria bambusicola]|uniref:D-isomer specific 2-hydroxyacid dehydrogenase n=1 Tax=Xylaria bambusicola TaxID=326684 RepID=UPI002008706F|nr:D-isomer specific 2-hydroxyacid dehydrogenase [Xylaria bambusicola]KAI0518500.1 D-isomer specific 2-hydroxyacid dehydrogenase [Xylaria bambusicola]